jgi:hypothetical protein
LKEEIRTELNRELAVKTKKLDDLKIKYTQRVADLQVARDTFTDSKWRDVASVQEALRDITVTNETNRQKTDEKGKELAVLQQGLTAIVQRVNRALVQYLFIYFFIHLLLLFLLIFDFLFVFRFLRATRIHCPRRLISPLQPSTS